MHVSSLAQLWTTHNGAEPGYRPNGPALTRELLSPRAGDVLEFAVLSSVKQKDDAGFERNYSQLRTYYTDTRCRELLHAFLECETNALARICQQSWTRHT